MFKLEGIKWVELKYTDITGKLRSIVISPGEELVAGVDGSSIGVESVESSDVFIVGDPRTLVRLPWNASMARAIGNIYKTRDQIHPLDPRSIASRLDKYLMELGYKPRVGVEVEFFLFRDMNLSYKPPFTYRVKITPVSVYLKNISTGYQVAYSQLEEYENEVVNVLEESFRIRITRHHHEVASSQLEITLAVDTVLGTSDNVQTVKYVAKKIAELKGLKACFAPKPLPGENGSGMHIHISLGDDNKNLFYDPNDEYGLSQLARYFIGGLLAHARALAALVAPTVNSYRRLIPGYEAPVYVMWGIGNRSACVRVPVVTNNDSVRVEFRVPDPSSNPYLAISAVILAGLDGIRKSIDPGEPLLTSAYSLEKVPREKRLPSSLIEALEELESDNEFLKPIFPRELLERYIELKKKEYREITQVPTPVELLVYD